MPYIKSISIHSTPKQSITYILNPDKTENLLYASGINCSADKDIVYEEMKTVFENYSQSLFDERKSINSKTPVKLFHYINSYRPTDEITPEQAHELAEEWAKKSFGKDRQMLIATHVDKGHVHSHIIINPYDLNGKKWNSNKTTLNAVRELSNAVAQKYNIKPTEPKNKKSGRVSYKEWSEKKKGTSWKQQIKDSIDRLVYSCEDLEELYRKLAEQGYKIKRGKHTAVSVPTAENEKKKTVRIDNIKSFGEGYDDDTLEQRIELAKEQKKSAEEEKIREQKNNLSPLEKLYRKRIFEVGQLVRSGQKVQKKYSKKYPYSIENDYEVYRLAKHLQIINRDSIASIDHLEKQLAETKTAYENARNELNKANEKNRQFETVIQYAEQYLDLRNIPPEKLSETEKLKLKISTEVIRKAGVKSDEDIEKIKKGYEIHTKKIERLNAAFEELEKRFSEYADISEKYKEITQRDYIEKLVEEKKRQERKNDLQ